MPERKKGLSPAVSAGVLCLVIGGVLGYYLRFATEPAFMGEAPPPRPAMVPPGAGGRASGPGSSPPATPAGAPAGGAMGGMGGGGMQPSPGMALARTVRNLDMLQAAQGRGITPAQAAALGPILRKLQSTEKLSEKDAQAHADAIEKVLTPAQKEALAALQPQRGMMGGGPGGPGGMMGGGRPDPERPFASERSRKALESLMSRLGAAK